MSETIFCNVCDEELTDPSATRCSNCGVFLNPLKNPVLTFEQRANTGSISPVDSDPLAEGDASDPVRPSDPLLEPAEINVLSIQDSPPTPAPQDSNIQFLSDVQAADSEQKETAQTILFQDPNDPLGPDTVANSVDDDQGSDRGPAEEEKEIDSDELPEAIGASISSSSLPTASDFRQINSYRGMALCVSGLALAVWSLVICIQTNWAIVPAVSGMVFAVLGSIFQRNKFSLFVVGLSVVSVSLIMASIMGFFSFNAR